MSSKLQEVHDHAAETIADVERLAAEKAADRRAAGDDEAAVEAAVEEVLRARSYLLAHQLQWVLGIGRAQQEHVHRLQGVFAAAKAVAMRPDTDNLARLAIEVREVEGWVKDRTAEASVTPDGPAAPA